MDSVDLRHGRAYNLGSGRVAVHFVSNPQLDGEPVRAELVVAVPGVAEQHVTVREGEQFPVGTQTWALAGVDKVGSYDYVVRIARVDDHSQ